MVRGELGWVQGTVYLSLSRRSVRTKTHEAWRGLSGRGPPACTPGPVCSSSMSFAAGEGEHRPCRPEWRCCL